MKAHDCMALMYESVVGKLFSAVDDE